MEKFSVRNNRSDTKQYPAYEPQQQTSGLADLQTATVNALKKSWGFCNSKFKIKRYKVDQDTWQLTVVNPKTQQTILQAEGHGDTIFAHEDTLARMAEALLQQGLTIRTQFDD
ncbi:MAG TPA: hypothetical protein VIQ81_03650 [Gammaproteobacteria bacterium]